MLCHDRRPYRILRRFNPAHVKSYLNRHNRASKSGDAYEYAPIHAPCERLFEKVENHRVVVALHFAHYNLVRLHKTIRCTPAMAGRCILLVVELRGASGTDLCIGAPPWLIGLPNEKAAPAAMLSLRARLSPSRSPFKPH